jgi:hypothetical protein
MRKRQSTFRATPVLIEAVAHIPVNHHLGETVILRDQDGNPIPYNDDDLILDWRNDIEEQNEALASVQIGLGSRIIRTGDRLQVGNLNLGVARNSFYRIWNGGFDFGGRWYGPFWQSLSKSLRAGLTINGYRIVELDYPQHHPTLLAGRILAFDVYYIPEFSTLKRSVIKITWNVMVNADSEEGAVRAAFNAIVKSSKKKAREIVKAVETHTADPDDPMVQMALPIYLTAEHKNEAIRHIAKEIRAPYPYSLVQRLVEAIKRRYPDTPFFTGAGRRLMRIDSEMTAHIQRKLRQKGEVILSVHDSYLGPAKGQMQEAMDEALGLAFRGQFGEVPRH